MNAPEWNLNPRVKPPTDEPASQKVPTPRTRFDSAKTGPENREHWKHADSLSPNAAANAADRKILRERARYEVANNSFAYGAANSLADDAIGTGPRLQLILDDADEEKVRSVEDLWQSWCDETTLGDTLRLMYRSQCVDGEGLAVTVDNPRLEHPVKLHLREVECDRLTDSGGFSLTTINLSPGQVDGIKFDSAGNPVRYTILRNHPGDALATPVGEWDEYPASQVYHLFRADRAGQGRGVSWLTPALPLFAQLRRYTLAVLSAAETAANIAGVLHTNAPASGDGDAPTIETMDQVPIPRNALLTLPNEWQATSFQGDQPQQQFGDFRTQILVEIGRALDMPLNRITGNSSGYNYSSGRLDHLGYQRGVWQQRDRLRLIILDRLFRAWYDEALLAGAIPADLPPMSDWCWDWQWDAFGDIDPSKEASAAESLLQNNLTTLAEQCAARGLRWDQVLRQRAREQALMTELGLSMVAEQPAGAGFEQSRDPREIAGAARLGLMAPLACGGEGGPPGPCPGGGESDAPGGQEKEDAEVDAQQEKEREGLAGKHEAENSQVEKDRGKEDKQIERDREKADSKEERATEKAVDKAKENIQKDSEKREKETPTHKEWQKQVDEHGEQSKEAKEAYDKHTKDFLDKEDKKVLEKQAEAEKNGEKHLEEHRQQQAEKHGKEDAARGEKRQAEDKARGDRQAKESKDLDGKHEQENRAIDEKRKVGKAQALPMKEKIHVLA